MNDLIPTQRQAFTKCAFIVIHLVCSHYLYPFILNCQNKLTSQYLLGVYLPCQLPWIKHWATARLETPAHQGNRMQANIPTTDTSVLYNIAIKLTHRNIPVVSFHYSHRPLQPGARFVLRLLLTTTSSVTLKPKLLVQSGHS